MAQQLTAPPEVPGSITSNIWQFTLQLLFQWIHYPRLASLSKYYTSTVQTYMKAKHPYTYNTSKGSYNGQTKISICCMRCQLSKTHTKITSRELGLDTKGIFKVLEKELITNQNFTSCRNKRGKCFQKRG